MPDIRAAGLTIREVSEKTGIAAHTLRYYERIGLIAPVTRVHRGHRRYGADELRWVELVKRLHGSGMTIRRMLEFARLARRGETTVAARSGEPPVQRRFAAAPQSPQAQPGGW